MQRRVLVSMIALLSAAGFAMAQAQPATPPKPAPSPKTVPVTPKGDAPEKTEATLKKGSAAPAIQMTEWVKGSAVTGFEKGKVYVVEFWATWCPPCRESIPHLTKLQKDHKDITVIGVAASERKGKEGDDRLKKLKEFVTKQGDKMDYTIGYDADRKMGTNWLKAAGQDGIPCAFIVGADGKISWIGNPLDDKFNDEVDGAIKAAVSAGPKVEPKPKKG